MAKRKKKVVKFSWRKASTAALTLATSFCLAGTFQSDSYSKETVMEMRHNTLVEKVLSAYEGYNAPENPFDACITPGSKGKIIKDSVFADGIKSERENFITQNRTKFDNLIENPKGYEHGPFIRPVDGGQDLSIESKVRITGFNHNIRGIIRHGIGLRIIPKIPDILPHYFSVDSLKINSEVMPQGYVESRGPNENIDRIHYYLDILKLVNDGILSEDDLKKGLEVIINSRIEISEILPIHDEDVAGMSAYKNVPEHLKRYTESTEELPSDHPEIQKIVSAYEGNYYNVLDLMKYALDVTIKKFECQVKDDGTNIMEVLKSGKGDCEHYSKLFTTICRAFGIPTRYVRGNTITYDEKSFSDSYHMWLEVLTPFKDGTSRWVLVEPTWADNEADPYEYINHVFHRYLYSIDFGVELDTSNHSDTFYVFQEHSWVSRPVPDPKKMGQSVMDFPAGLTIEVQKEDGSGNK